MSNNKTSYGVLYKKKSLKSLLISWAFLFLLARVRNRTHPSPMSYIDKDLNSYIFFANSLGVTPNFFFISGMVSGGIKG
jgi:hypothetical protein